MRVVLIPGMDGTGILFDPFIERTPAGIEAINLPLIQSSDISYEDQAKYVINKVGDEPIVLVAESYSGMIAYNMLQMGCANIKHLVFAASFVSRPSWLASLAKYMPISILKSSVTPKLLVGKILFGHYSTPDLISLFYRSILSVEDDVLERRFAQISTLSEPKVPIKVPCTYIRPRGDWMVSMNSIERLDSLCDNLSIREVDGTHFVLQTNPQACWHIIQSAIV